MRPILLALSLMTALAARAQDVAPELADPGLFGARWVSVRPAWGAGDFKAFLGYEFHGDGTVTVWSICTWPKKVVEAATRPVKVDVDARSFTIRESDRLTVTDEGYSCAASADPATIGYQVAGASRLRLFVKSHSAEYRR